MPLCHPTEADLDLLYVGIAPSGTTSASTLLSRIVGNHMPGNIAASTLRRTLAALLIDELALTPLANGSKITFEPRDVTAPIYATGWGRQRARDDVWGWTARGGDEAVGRLPAGRERARRGVACLRHWIRRIKKMATVAQLVARVLRSVDQELADQQAIVASLEAMGLLSLPGVAGVGVGYQSSSRGRSGTVGPVVWIHTGRPGRQQVPRGIPRLLRAGRRNLRVEVRGLGPVLPLCQTGIADDQNDAYPLPTPPGVAICGLDAQGQSPPGSLGTGGIVVKDNANPNQQYLLTAKHVAKKNMKWAQPWTQKPPEPNPTPWKRGTCAKDSGTLDASLLTGDAALSPTVHCIGGPKAFNAAAVGVGMRVMKSGAATGVTCGKIVFVGPLNMQNALANLYSQACKMVVIDNDPIMPAAQPGLVTNYTYHGDSGSASLVGTPSDPRDPTVDTTIIGDPYETQIATVPQAQRAAVRAGISAGLRGCAVGLNVACSTPQALAAVGTLPQGVQIATARLALAIQMDVALTDLGVTLVPG